MTTRQFNLDDQRLFARLSGDANPMHVDPVLARRMMFGNVVVHGIHGVLWALDAWASYQMKCEQADAVLIEKLSVTFPKPMFLDEAIECEITSGDDSNCQFQLLSRGLVVLRMSLHWCRCGQARNPVDDRFPEQLDSRPIPAGELAGKSGTVPVVLEEQLATRMFPNLVRTLANDQLAFLLATTRLVGAECPGFRSLYSAVQLKADPMSKDARLDYQVVSYDQRFNMVSMDVRGAGLTGQIRAFHRPAPVEQAKFQELKKVVRKDEFADQRAVVIGGSRGLGEVVAKLLAAGGASVTLTYLRGLKEGNQIVEEIEAQGGTADAIQFDVTAPDFDTTRYRSGQQPSHIYYMATPFIAPGSQGRFTPSLFEQFTRYYVNGFNNTFELFCRHGSRFFFYPSTVFVEQTPPDMCEYAAAKIAGEQVCYYLSKTVRDVNIRVVRLPRLATDQTVSVMPTDTGNPIELLLEELRAWKASL